ncbi:MAG: CPBP family intramembrane metalloprotease [Candidatus Micrarchaeota archaeon]|nr:CPBP family intramembrane metalloprotease [Candidatus Micrarchaeota archaeon]
MAARRARRAPSGITRFASYIISLLLVAASLAICVLYIYKIVPFSFAEANLSITLSLFFPSIVFSYLLYRKKSLPEIIGQIGLSRKGFTFRNLAIGVSMFLAILVMGLAFGLFSQATGIPLPTNVALVLSGMPIYFLIFASLVAPFNEEILFRGFLVNRIGILLSALVFAFLHSGYASVSELVAALVFGLLAGYVFKRTNSIYPCILAHILVNVMAVIAIS